VPAAPNVAVTALPGYLLRFRANDVAGGAVSKGWRAVAGPAHVQAVGSPKYQQGVLNGKAGVILDGSSALDVTDYGAPAAGNQTVYAVFKSGPGHQGSLFATYRSSVRDGLWTGRGTVAGPHGAWARLRTSTDEFAVVTVRWDGHTLSSWTNGFLVGRTGTSEATPARWDKPQFGGNGSAHAVGTLCDFAMFNAAHTDDQVRQAVASLMHEYGMRQ
jgi:hypothetical protein